MMTSITGPRRLLAPERPRCNLRQDPMADIEICPQCGAPRQCSFWRRCACGHDFGPSSHPTAGVAEPVPDGPEWDLRSARRRRRIMHWLGGTAFVVLFFSSCVHHLPDWLTKAAASIAVF